MAGFAGEGLEIVAEALQEAERVRLMRGCTGFEPSCRCSRMATAPTPRVRSAVRSRRRKERTSSSCARPPASLDFGAIAAGSKMPETFSRRAMAASRRVSPFGPTEAATDVSLGWSKATKRARHGRQPGLMSWKSAMSESSHWRGAPDRV
ncbi:MAG: hypothetical protein JWL84_4778 [Rhodospirillales bacterium]|nr:hypothetical protein [Rhodospirillales bacterium]